MEDSPAFVSYCRADSEFALKLASDLKAAGANVWMDQLDIEPGMRWDRAVEKALLGSRHLLVVVSSVSNESENVSDEVSFALDPLNKKRVIPILFQDCVVPFRLARLQYIDLRLGYDHGLQSLVKVLRGPQPPVPAPSPLSTPSSNSTQAPVPNPTPAPNPTLAPNPTPALPRPTPPPAPSAPPRPDPMPTPPPSAAPLPTPTLPRPTPPPVAPMVGPPVPPAVQPTVFATPAPLPAVPGVTLSPAPHPPLPQPPRPLPPAWTGPVAPPTNLTRPIVPGPIVPGPIVPGPIVPGPIVPGPIVPGPIVPGRIPAGKSSWARLPLWAKVLLIGTVLLFAILALANGQRSKTQTIVPIPAPIVESTPEFQVKGKWTGTMFDAPATLTVGGVPGLPTLEYDQANNHMVETMAAELDGRNLKLTGVSVERKVTTSKFSYDVLNLTLSEDGDTLSGEINDGNYKAPVTFTKKD